LLGEPFCEDFVHSLRRECYGRRELDVVLRHGCDLDVLGVWKVFQGRAVEVSEELDGFTNTIGAVVEEEQGVAICRSMSANQI
jgi:hypothetical protein